jgi:hypothetical protein
VEVNSGQCEAFNNSAKKRDQDLPARMVLFFSPLKTAFSMTEGKPLRVMRSGGRREALTGEGIRGRLS